ncbi:Oxidoreductase molybdopterin binding domain-containing protein [Fictibacillus enclensis]|uniref:Oxidoreductase n=1 Tax=Fictibacillus enclensis TaxID=1017270 RepID=A0A0V8J932_9BACL|nr:sulfite oxidase-like oxidoreductase [Fictibacillus enclensis]KSU83441.1 oxidoreductase [Fictibacillus enclensis]SCC15552.1 Oxidoreductase molybdopterin binding domain-containing protein [Fictibacillus enclensis]
MFFGKPKVKKENDRVPPNQNVTTKWPVLHVGNVPYYPDLTDWDLKVYGMVEKPTTFTYDELLTLPRATAQNDIHCVTGWSKLDNVWEGVAVKDIVKDVGIHPSAKYVLLHAEEGWTTNLPLEDFLKESSLLAHTHNGESLSPEHGYPLRAVVPHLYFWKSAKWLRGIEFLPLETPGFWEKNGYHMYGDPWKEERFSWD